MPWLVLVERNDEGVILSIISKKVDGKKVKENTWYENIGGKLVEC